MFDIYLEELALYMKLIISILVSLATQESSNIVFGSTAHSINGCVIDYSSFYMQSPQPDCTEQCLNESTSSVHDPHFRNVINLAC